MTELEHLNIFNTLIIITADTLDHIFSFLTSDKKTLRACSEIPGLYPLVERHLFSRLTVHISSTNPLISRQLSELVSAPHRNIRHYVRYLTIETQSNRNVADNQIVTQLLDEFANTLLKFTMLVCIHLSSKLSCWRRSTVFQAALENCLKLPTVQEVHFHGDKDFPFSLFDSCQHIKHLSLSGLFWSPPIGAPALPQLKSLTLDSPMISPLFTAWIKLYITELRSLKYDASATPFDSPLAELIAVCSWTLNKLDINVVGVMPIIPKNYLNLQQLIVRTKISPDEDGWSNSYLPEAVEVIISISSPRHLATSNSIRLIDLYVHTGVLPSTLTHSQLMSSLGDYKEVVRLIEEGVLVIHSEKTAPD